MQAPTFIIDSSIVSRILNELSNLEQLFQDHQATILTEDDLKCLLFARLNTTFSVRYNTMNPGITGTVLHAEVKFYDERGKLTLIPDISIIAPQDLSIFHSVEFGMFPTGPRFKPLPRKKFEFAGDALIIELKFCRWKGGITLRDIAKYQQDLDKIKRLQEIRRTRTSGQNQLYGIVAVFNKTNKGKAHFDEFMRMNPFDPTTSIFYGTGNIVFPTRRQPAAVGD